MHLVFTGVIFRFVSRSQAECPLLEASTRKRHPDGRTDVRNKGLGRMAGGGGRRDEGGWRREEGGGRRLIELDVLH